MSHKVPTLSIHGWIDNTLNRMNKLFEHFLASDYSQSTQLIGHVSSLKYILASTKNIIEIKNSIDKALNKLYKAYFDDVVTDVRIEEVADDTKIRIFITITITENNKVNMLKKAVESKNGNIVNWYNASDNLNNQY